jgi:hypothetical protein
MVAKTFIIDRSINIITAAGNSTKQADLLLKFIGGQVVGKSFFSDIYNDEIFFIFFNEANLKNNVYQFTHEISALNLPEEAFETI